MQVRAEMGQQIHKKSIKDYLCCCCGPKHLPIDPQEQDSLLTKQQEVEMNEQNPKDGASKQGKSKKHKKRRSHTSQSKMDLPPPADEYD